MNCGTLNSFHIYIWIIKVFSIYLEDSTKHTTVIKVRIVPKDHCQSTGSSQVALKRFRRDLSLYKEMGSVTLFGFALDGISKLIWYGKGDAVALLDENWIFRSTRLILNDSDRFTPHCLSPYILYYTRLDLFRPKMGYWCMFLFSIFSCHPLHHRHNNHNVHTEARFNSIWDGPRPALPITASIRSGSFLSKTWSTCIIIIIIQPASGACQKFEYMCKTKFGKKKS